MDLLEIMKEWSSDDKECEELDWDSWDRRDTES
jgi:hypothetical protein